jgi:hypothetical protein
MNDTKVKNHSTLLAPDDLNVDDLVTIHSIKADNTTTCPAMGVALQVKAINFPYFTVRTMGGQPLIMDTRFLNFMRVTQEYADSQKGSM